MIGTIDVEIMAANPSMPLYPVRAFKNSPSSIRLRNVPKHIGDWNINSVQIVAAYPDSSIKTASCVLTGSVWVGTIEGCPISGRSENGFTVFASGTDENGNPVSNYVLGKGLVEILEGDGTITPDAPSYYVHLLDEQPTTPKEGDMWPTDDGYAIWQDGEAHSLGGSSITVDAELSTTSTNPVQNKVVTAELNRKQQSITPGAIETPSNILLSLWAAVKQNGILHQELVYTSYGVDKLLSPKANSSDVTAALELKADAASLPYALVNVVPSNGTAPLTDRAINAVSLTESATLVMPAAISGHARDLVVRLAVGADGLNITWGAADAGGIAVDYETDDGNFPDLSAAGNYLVRLTETAAVAAGTGGAADVPAKFLIQNQPLLTATATQGGAA